MNTHDIDIELPPLPEGMILEGIWAVAEDELIAYRDACINAAIEADRQARKVDKAGYTSGPVSDGGFDPRNANYRQARGEPVAWTTPDGREPISAPLKESRLDLYSKHYTVPLYTAPQPVEPSGAPNLYKDSCGAQNENQTPQPAEPDVLPGEAVFGFAAWLTGLKVPVTFSECHGAAVGADLAAAYNTSQGFDQVREDYHKRLKPFPKDEPSQPAETGREEEK